VGVQPPPAPSAPTPPVPEAIVEPSPVVPVPAAAPAEPPSTENVDLDPAALQFFLSPRYAASSTSVQKNFSLSDDDRILLEDLDRLVLGGKTDLEGYLVALEEEFGSRLSEEQRDTMYAQLLAERFLPFGDRLKPNAMEVARAENLKLPPVSHYQIYVKPLTYSGAATEVASSAGFSLMGGPIRERLRELILSKAKGVRADVQVLDALTRSIDVGGLGLDRPTADKALAAMNDIISRANVMSEDEYANWLSDEARKKAAPVAPPVIAQDVPLSPDEAEIAAIQARMPKPGPSSELDKAIEATVQTLTYKPDDEYISKRLRNVISSRLRNVRSQMELKQLLMRDTKVGGMGMDATQAEGLAKQIEQAYLQFHETIAQEEKSKIDTQLEEQKRKIEDRRKREAEEHAKWFEDKIRTRKTGEAQKSQVVEDMRRVMGGQTSPVAPAHPVDAKEERVQTAKFGPLVPVTQPLQKKDVPTQVKVSPATIELAQKAPSRPSLDGMSYGGPQLVGLVGELKALSVAEFRRLSKNPQEAAMKIRQKIETLEQESFDKKVDGIRAFQESKLQGAYMALVGESFRTMKPVVALAEEKRKAGSDTLSPDEIAAIVALNSALHF
jgi:hypothetical protein